MYNIVKLFDLDFISAPSLADIIDSIMDYQHTLGDEKKLPFVITPNADQIVKLSQPEHKILKEKLCNVQFILPDGQPIIWFSRLVRKPLPARLTGSDLFPLLWQKIKLHRQKILVIISNEALGLKLKQDYDNIIYYAPPFFEANTPSQDKIAKNIVSKIEEFQPKYVLVGVGFPKQEWLSLTIHTTLLKLRIPSPLFLCLGASAEFYVGTRKRAPLLLQKVGLEWLHRLWLEPKRMWRRYIIGGMSLLILFSKEFKRELSRRRNSST